MGREQEAELCVGVASWGAQPHRLAVTVADAFKLYFDFFEKLFHRTAHGERLFLA